MTNAGRKVTQEEQPGRGPRPPDLFPSSRTVATAATVIGRLMRPLRFRGKGRLGLLLGNLVARVSREVRCRPAAGPPVWVDLRDRIECLMWCGAYEQETEAVFRLVLSQGDVVLDVGAHIGYFSVIAGGLVGSTGQVHAFEPDRRCFANLQANVARWPQVVPWNAAASDGSGTSLLYRSPAEGESGWSSILPTEEPRAATLVTTIALDEWADAHDIGRLDLVKIDAEGAEARIVAGARGLLTRCRPTLVFEVNEVCLARDGQAACDLVREVQALGYDLWEVLAPTGRQTGTLLGLERGRMAKDRPVKLERGSLRPIL